MGFDGNYDMVRGGCGLAYVRRGALIYRAPSHERRGSYRVGPVGQPGELVVVAGATGPGPPGTVLHRLPPAAVPEIARGSVLADRFGAMVRSRQPEQLDPLLADASAAQAPREFHGFAKSLLHDYAAVKAGPEPGVEPRAGGGAGESPEADQAADVPAGPVSICSAGACCVRNDGWSKDRPARVPSALRKEVRRMTINPFSPAQCRRPPRHSLVPAGPRWACREHERRVVQESGHFRKVRKNLFWHADCHEEPVLLRPLTTTTSPSISSSSRCWTRWLRG